MKKIIALFLSLLMILTSVNITFAAAATKTVTDFTPVTIRSSDVLTNQIYTSVGTHIGVINYDLTQYLPELYFADSVKLTVKSNSWSASNNNKMSLEIIPDSKEVYVDCRHNYKQAAEGGVFSDGIEIYPASEIGTNPKAHTTDNIKDTLINALESGNNNKLSIRLVLAEQVESTNVGILADPELIIDYDDAVTDTAYYEEILKSFNLEEKAEIDLDNITSDFVLPTFYKGSNISWSSDKANISISADGVASVTKPSDNDEKVTLTATLSYKDGSSYETSFIANVIKKTALENLADRFTSTYKVSDEDYSAITKDLKLDKTFEGATLSWVSSNEDVIKAETGRVIRSESGDVQVALTPTIFCDGESLTLDPVNVKVKKITASTAVASFTTAGTLISDGRILLDESPTSYLSGRFGIINFDLTDYLPQIYMANTIKLKLKSGSYSATSSNVGAVVIVSDNKESYTDGTQTYNKAVAAGVLSDGTQIYYADPIGYDGASHTIADIKDTLIKELESGNNNNISLRLVAVNGSVSLRRYGEFEIMYDSSLATDEAYYEKISKEFDLESIANIDLASVKSDFTLPTFFKGSKISWTSDKACIAISSDGTASVTRSDLADETVTLTATLSYKDGSSYPMTFKATVPEKTVPVIEAVKNNDGTFSAVIKSNETVSVKYTLYFASYSSDNALIGIYAYPVKSLTDGVTTIDADSEKFLTNDAAKIKCILLKDDLITPVCKNGEVDN